MTQTVWQYKVHIQSTHTVLTQRAVVKLAAATREAVDVVDTRPVVLTRRRSTFVYVCHKITAVLHFSRYI